MVDRRLLRFRPGDEEEGSVQGDFVEVYERQLAPVWRYVRARVPDDHEAEELTSEVFYRAYRDRRRYDASRGTAGAWLAGIARHVVTDWWRRRGREVVSEAPPDSAAGHDSDDDEPLAAALRSDAVEQLRGHMDGLSERERDALALRFGAELKAAEVGAALGVSEAAAKMLVHRAISKLRAVMPRE
jgi:RNA polymerase sigma factor (sigma-70 family)